MEDMILSCLAEGQVGGETILVSAKNVYEKLRKNFKQANKILQKKFIWEKKRCGESFLYRSDIKN